MTDIVIQGIYGRMGHALIEKIAARQDCRVVAGVDREAGKVGDIPVYAGFEGLPKVDAIIDFSSPAGAVAAVQYGAVHGVPCVICSTGLSAEDETVLEDASAKTPIFRSANMSLGVNVLIELARQAEQAGSTVEFKDEIDFETFEKVDMTVCKVKSCENVKKSKKLLKFILDDGSGKDRQILSGIAAYYKPEELVGKTVVAVTNLAPRKMMGQESCGMLLSAEKHDKLQLIILDDAIEAGAKFC